MSYPDRADCVTCHNASTGGTLGTRTRFLNKNITYPKTGRSANQLVTLSHLGILDEVITDADTPLLLTYKAMDDATASLDEKARSYLDLNCAYCHQAGSGIRADFDLRMSLNLASTGLLDAGIFNSLGVPNEQILASGTPERSHLFLRANSLVDGVAMPPVAKNKVDAAGVALLEAWIRQLGAEVGPNDNNLALNKPVLQSGTDFNGPAERAVDGNRSGNFNNGSVTHTNLATNPWWRVDLGAVYNLDKINIYNRTDCCSDRLNGALVLVGNTASNTPADYTQVGTLNGDATGFLSEINAQGRYIMVYLPGTNEILSLAEVEVYGEPAITVPVYNVVVSPNAVDMTVGQTFQLTASTEPSNATNQRVTWFSNDPNIAAIDENTGVVTAIGNGAIDVTATTADGGFRASAQIRVSGGAQAQVAVYNVLMAPAQVTLDLGETFQLVANVEPSNATDKGVSWFSNNTNIASIDANTGLVTATGAGSIDVTVTTNDGGYRASATITVNGGPPPPIAVYDVKVNPVEITMNVGETFLLNASVEPANATNQEVSWFSNDPNIVSIEAATGLVTANAIGVMDVTAKTDDGGYQASVLINVVATDQNAINLFPIPATGSVNMDLGNFMGQAVTVQLFGQNNQLLETIAYGIDHPEVVQLALDSYPSGYYYLLFQTAIGYEAKPLIIN